MVKYKDLDTYINKTFNSLNLRIHSLQFTTGCSSPDNPCSQFVICRNLISRADCQAAIIMLKARYGDGNLITLKLAIIDGYAPSRGGPAASVSSYYCI